MPKDILPILSKDEDKQKAIEAKAQSSLHSAKADAEAKKVAGGDTKPTAATTAAKSPEPTSAATPKGASKKIVMNIPAIPPFNPTKRKPSTSGTAPAIPITESAKQDIPVAASPAPSAAGSQNAETAKLNPKASAFVFKPTAAAFKPGQPSTPSPAARAGQIAVSLLCILSSM